MRAAIVTDSNNGITQEQAKELGLYVLPMPFMIDGKEYLEGIERRGPQELAEMFMEFAGAFAEGARDDMTVLAAGIWKR